MPIRHTEHYGLIVTQLQNYKKTFQTEWTSTLLAQSHNQLILQKLISRIENQK